MTTKTAVDVMHAPCARLEQAARDEGSALVTVLREQLAAMRSAREEDAVLLEQVRAQRGEMTSQLKDASSEISRLRDERDALLRERSAFEDSRKVAP